MTRRIIPIAILAALLALETAAFAGSPFTLSYGGRLTDASGQPVAGPVNLTLRFFDASTGGNQLGSDVDAPNVTLVNGVFQAPVTLTGAQHQQIFGSGNAAFVEVTDTTHAKTYPRQAFSAVPYALQIPVDGATLGYDGNGNLTVQSIPQTQVAGLGGSLTALSTGVAGKADTSAVAALSASVSSLTLTGASSGDFLKWSGTQWSPGSVTGTSGGTVTSVTTTAPLTTTGNPTTAPTIGITQAGVAASGFLSSADWQAFNAKQPAGSYQAAGSYVNTAQAVNTTAPLAGGGVLAGSLTLSLAPASGTANGYLASGDWSAFNAKQPFLTAGAATTPLVYSGGAFSMPQAANGTSGYLAGGDWTTFNAKQPAGNYQPAGSYVTQATNVSTTAPLTGGGALASGLTLGLAAATAGGNGYLASADWATFNGRQPALGYAPVNRAGDTMTGSLALPANGLAVGTTQLVATGGKIGIGTTNPLYLLHAHATTDQNLAVRGPVSAASGVSVTSANDAYNTWQPLELVGNPTILGMGGSVGIGTTGPTSTLDVNGWLQVTSPDAGHTGGVRVRAPVDGNPGYLQFTNNAANAEWADIMASSAGHLILEPASGNVGIGTTTPSAALAVVGRVLKDTGVFADAMIYCGSVTYTSTTFTCTSVTGSLAQGAPSGYNLKDTPHTRQAICWALGARASNDTSPVTTTTGTTCSIYVDGTNHTFYPTAQCGVSVTYINNITCSP